MRGQSWVRFADTSEENHVSGRRADYAIEDDGKLFSPGKQSGLAGEMGSCRTVMCQCHNGQKRLQCKPVFCRR